MKALIPYFSDKKKHSISLMSLEVECEVVRSGKSSITMRAFEWFDPSVFSEVASEFIGAGKLPVAAFPTALVGLFSSVSPLVCLEVRALGVDLVASRIGAAMNSLVALRRLSVVVNGIH